MFTLKIIILFLLISFNYLSAQVTQEWVAAYNGMGTGDNVPNKIVIDKFGNIYVGGRSENLNGDNDYITLKYNSSGNLIWGKRYNGIGNNTDEITDIVLDDSGNVYVTGDSYEGAMNGNINWVTIKYNPKGDTLWKRSFSGIAGGLDEPFSMTIDKKNNIYITGFCLVNAPIDEDMFTIKYNPDGNLQWARSYTSEFHGSNWGYSVVTDDSNNIYSSGYGNKSFGNEIVSIKYNSAGEELWIKKFPTYGGDYLRPVKSATDKYNNLIVNGFYYITGDYDFITLKYTSTGELLWNRVYNGTANNLDFCFALCIDSATNVYAAGRSTNSVTDADFVTIKYDQYGNTMWIKCYDGGDSLFDEAHSIIVDNSKNVYVTGVAQSYSTSRDYLTLKYDSNGVMKWAKKYKGNFFADLAYCIGLDSDNNAIISGGSQLNINNSSITTIKYSEITGILLENTRTITTYELSNFPNPFNSQTLIKYTLSISGNIKISIYDIKGREIEGLVNEYQKEGEHKVIFDANKYSSGVYFYTLELNNNLMKTSKMLLLK